MNFGQTYPCLVICVVLRKGGVATVQNTLGEVAHSFILCVFCGLSLLHEEQRESGSRKSEQLILSVNIRNRKLAIGKKFNNKKKVFLSKIEIGSWERLYSVPSVDPGKVVLFIFGLDVLRHWRIPPSNRTLSIQAISSFTLGTKNL